MRKLVARTLRAVAVLAALALLGIAALLASLWLEHRRETALPAPTGPFAVGRAIYAWRDDAARDTLAPVPDARRELLAWIWYPAAASPSGAPMDDYLPAALRAEFRRLRGPVISNILTRDLSKVRSHSRRNASVAPQRRSYPVVILRGGASAEVVNYSTLAEDLASHGYIVVGIDAPYRTNVVVFPDGRVMRRTPENDGELCLGSADEARCVNRLLTAWTADIGFALDRLERLNADASSPFGGRIDLTRVGVVGHSFGGAQAAQFCHDDSRCKAGADVDGVPFGSVVQEGLRGPFMFLVSEQIHGSDPQTRRVKADIQSIYDRLPSDGRLWIAIRGSNHFTFSDDWALLKSRIVVRALRLSGVLRLDGPRQLAVTAYCLRIFFDTYLEGQGARPPGISSPLYPEIEVVE